MVLFYACAEGEVNEVTNKVRKKAIGSRMSECQWTFVYEQKIHRLVYTVQCLIPCPYLATHSLSRKEAKAQMTHKRTEGASYIAIFSANFQIVSSK
jgi:hypothetical protein